MDHGAGRGNETIYFYPFFLLGKKMKTWHTQNSGGVKHCIGQNYWPMNCPTLLHRVSVCVKTFYIPTASVNNEHKQGGLWGKLKVTNRMPLKINKTNQPTHASNSSDSTMQTNPIMEYRRIKWSGSKSVKGHFFFFKVAIWPLFHIFFKCVEKEEPVSSGWHSGMAWWLMGLLIKPIFSPLYCYSCIYPSNMIPLLLKWVLYSAACLLLLLGNQKWFLEPVYCQKSPISVVQNIKTN